MPEIKAAKKRGEEITTCMHHNSTPHAAKCKPSQLANNAEWRLNPNHFSSWSRLVRVQGRVRRVLHNMSQQGDNQTSNEIKEAEQELVRTCQRETFLEECKALSSGRPISNTSQRITMNPIIDEDGCIRSSGRLQFAEYLPYDVQSPLILPRGHWVTKLVGKQK